MKNKLKELRLNKKLSQTGFAIAFNAFLLTRDTPIKDYHGDIKGISYATVSRWETGQTPIPSIYFSSLADFFKVSVPYFQGLTASKEEDSTGKNKQNTLLKYKVVTTMTTEIQDFFTDKLVFKKMAGQQYLLAYNAETGRKVLINCKTIEFIENLSKRFEWQWVKEEDTQND